MNIKDSADVFTKSDLRYMIRAIEVYEYAMGAQGRKCIRLLNDSLAKLGVGKSGKRKK